MFNEINYVYRVIVFLDKHCFTLEKQCLSAKKQRAVCPIIQINSVYRAKNNVYRPIISVYREKLFFHSINIIYLDKHCLSPINIVVFLLEKHYLSELLGKRRAVWNRSGQQPELIMAGQKGTVVQQ